MIDPSYHSAIECFDTFQKKVQDNEQKSHVILAIEHEKKIVVCKEYDVFSDEKHLSYNLFILERLIKSLLWVVGGHRIYFAGPHLLYESLKEIFSPTGKRAFDIAFMEKIFQTNFEFLECDSKQIPQEKSIDSHFDSIVYQKRIGLDLGGTHIKICALFDDQIVYSQVIPWSPKTYINPHAHEEKILHAIQDALPYLQNDVDALGISSAGIFMDNQVRVSALFMKVDEQKYASFLPNLFLTIQNKLEKIVNHPIHMKIANDGDVTALSGAKRLQKERLLGLSLGTSEAASFIHHKGQLMGWLHELSFVPINWHENAMIDPWSLDRGTGASYLCQEGVIYLAKLCHIDLDKDASPAQKVKTLQAMAEQQDEKALLIFQTMGLYLADALAYYRLFYPIEHVLVLGGITNGKGGDILLSSCQEQLRLRKIPIELHSTAKENRQMEQAITASYL